MNKLRFALLLLLPLGASSQKHQWSAGLQANTGFTSANNLYTRNDRFLSYGLGAQILYSINDHWQAGLALQYSFDPHSGMADFRDNKDVPLYYHFTIKPHYLRIPVQIRHNWGKPQQKVRPYAYLSLIGGYNTDNNTLVVNFTALDAYTQQLFSSIKMQNPNNKMEISIAPGAGVAVKLGTKMQFHTEIFFAQGLNDIGDFSIGQPINNYQQQLKLQAGLLYALK